MIYPPCYKCEAHTPECHAKCVAYREWAARLKAERAEQRKHKEADAYTRTVIERIRRRCKP